VNAAAYLITGGAGFLGINLVRFLLARGQRVRSLDIAPFDYPERDAVEAIQGDIRDPAMVERAIAGVDLVIHCAAALPLYTREAIFSTDVEGTRLLLESALAHGVTRFVHISSTAVYGIPDHHPIHEDDRLEGVGAYGEAKIQAERVCLAFRARGMCVPILRPKSFVGPERLGVFELLYDWACDGRNFPVLGSGDNRYQLLDVEDLCRAIYLCATADRDLVNDTFNVGAETFGTMREDFQAVLDRAAHGGRVIGVPARPVIWALKILEWARFSTATPSAMARVFQAYGCRYAMLLDMNALEHTYLAVYLRQGDQIVVQHLIRGMEEVDKSTDGQVIPRFIGFSDNRDFFYLVRREDRS
jgi:nucleoside-diphosphate-sugar epimerase